ncbi:Spermidine synthase [Zostera marina]|uniref:Spermidine synthase n=1 Tax=Zostera marina TaxID=29655 RepID=A0A0K9PDB7_ZOSMR|nr:Spermidine synthase [Zostera marina]
MSGNAAAITDLARLHPSRYMTFTFPNPNPSSRDTLHLCISVLDSPFFSPESSPSPSSPPLTAAMLVPFGRESDWIFSTVEGHTQLMIFFSGSCSSPLSRLILIGNTRSSFPFSCYTKPEAVGSDTSESERNLLPLLLAVCPKSAFDYGIPTVPFLRFEDDVVSLVVVEKTAGPVVGEMVVEDVEISLSSSERLQRRRRLRFRRMPNLVQTQIRIPHHHSGESDVTHGSTGFIVQPYLAAMATGLCLIGPSLDEKVSQTGRRPCVLCLGVGGGGLLSFLQSQLKLDVVGIEADEVVLSISKRYFGLVEGEFLQVHVGDGITIVENWGKTIDRFELQFDAIMVDLDSGDATTGSIAPPSEFIKPTVIAGARRALTENGILVINVVAPLITRNYLSGLLKNLFSDLYEIDSGNSENYVVIATTSGAVESDSCFKTKVKGIIGNNYINSMTKYYI